MFMNLEAPCINLINFPCFEYTASIYLKSTTTLLTNKTGNRSQSGLSKEIVYRPRTNKWCSRLGAAPLRIHAKSELLCHFYVII